MARKGAVSIQDTVETNEEFDAYLDSHTENLIQMEVYADYCGFCVATANAVRKCKLELGGDSIDMVKACSDKIDALIRFQYKSEPTFLFIRNRKLKRVMFGANGIELVRVCEEMLELVQKERQQEATIGEEHDITEILPEESARIEEHQRIQQEHIEAVERLRKLTEAARKRRMCSRLGVQLRRMNWILFWPHNHQAHYDLYEKWDSLIEPDLTMLVRGSPIIEPRLYLEKLLFVIDLSVGAKETMDLTEDMVREALYLSDVELNEACLYSLVSAPALVVLFKMFETDNRDFVQLMRHAIYEEIPEPKEDVPPEKQLPPIPAYERYASVSKTPRVVRRERYEAKLQKLREEEEERERLRKETERLEREAREEEERLEKQRKDDERMARLAAGLPADPEPEPEPEAAAEEAEAGEEGEGPKEGEEQEGEAMGEATDDDGAGELAPEVDAPAEEPQIEVFNSDVSVEDEEYIPPGGLFIPGLYSPINDLAKANGLKLFFPKEVKNYTGLEKLESEVLPPHVLVMFNVDKRHEMLDVFAQYKDEILNMGFFVGDDPHTMQHVAFTVKQYDKMNRLRKHLDRLAVAVSRKRSLPLLQLTGFNPLYISSDVEAGEKECLTMFPVGYGDEYIEEESVKEEEVPETAAVVVSEVAEEAPVQEEQVEEEEDDIDI